MIVIAGAGEAGARAAVALRENGFDGQITLIGHEPHLPYERPPLSKAFMIAPDTPGATTILDESRLRQHDIIHFAGAQARSIDRDGRTVVLGDGRRLAFGKLLIATGSHPRRLPLTGEAADRVLYLRTFGDALLMREHLRPGARLVIIGGGFIGLELAASAVARGCAVTVVELAPRLLARGVPAEIAALVAERHRAAGVGLNLGAAIADVAREGDATRITLADGTRLTCDAVIAGIGAVPETALAAASGLTVENGVRTDEMLCTDDADIFAAGDCCSFPHPLYGGRRVRLEAWRNAQDQGNAAARNMLGANEPYDAVPWFWSDQYEGTLQIAGLPDEGRNTVHRDLGEGSALFFHLAGDGRLVATCGLGALSRVAREVRLAEMLITQRAHPDPTALASGAVKLRSLLQPA